MPVTPGIIHFRSISFFLIYIIVCICKSGVWDQHMQTLGLILCYFSVDSGPSRKYKFEPETQMWHTYCYIFSGKTVSQPPRSQPLGEKPFTVYFLPHTSESFAQFGLITWDLLWHMTGNSVSFSHGLNYLAPLLNWSTLLPSPPYTVASVPPGLMDLHSVPPAYLSVPSINTTFWPTHPLQIPIPLGFLKQTKFTDEGGDS